MSDPKQEYLTKHPEIKEIMGDMLAECLIEEPTDVLAFFQQHLAKKQSSSFAPLVVCGPSGVGKGTLIGMLKDKFGDQFGFSVSHTTRSPREGEEHGVHYYFSEHAEMELGISNGDFIESANVHGNYYGTSKKAVASVG